MVDVRPVLWIGGALLSVLGCMMALPAIADALAGNREWVVFAGSGAATLFLGLGLISANQHSRPHGLGLRQTFLVPVAGWVMCAVAAAMPLAFSNISLTDSLFEAVSGVTTTGATVLRGLDARPPGLLLWRSLLQWLGGAGTLTFGFLILPALKVGGMQVFRQDGGGRDDSMPRRSIIMLGRLLAVYGAATAVLAVLLRTAGMSPFDAVNHALTTICCGGFSTSDDSIGHWHSAAVDWVVLVGMLVGGAPFLVHVQLLSRQWRSGLANTQLRWYGALLLVGGSLIAGWLLAVGAAKPLPAVRHGLFAAVSVMTGSGFATLNWGAWLGPPSAVLLLLTMIGGCAGSTAGGIKVFRLQILLSNAGVQMTRLLWPNRVLLPAYQGVALSDAVAESVLGFLFVFLLAVALLSLGLAATGLDFASALSAAAAALANLGPGLTPVVGPLHGYPHLAEGAKWMLAAGMLFGRLEMFVVLALFAKGFWHD